jgi:hypothetical protein
MPLNIMVIIFAASGRDRGATAGNAILADRRFYSFDFHTLYRIDRVNA